MPERHVWLQIAPGFWRCRKCFAFAREDPTAGVGGAWLARGNEA